jgi:hypothetical protein
MKQASWILLKLLMLHAPTATTPRCHYERSEVIERSSCNALTGLLRLRLAMTALGVILRVRRKPNVAESIAAHTGLSRCVQECSCNDGAKREAMTMVLARLMMAGLLEV